MKLEPAIPVLRVFDHELAKKYYVGWLGFALDWEHPFDGKGPRYMQVSRSGLTLHLSEHYGDSTPGSRVFVNTDDVLSLHRELQSRPNPNMNPGVGHAPWNALCMEVIDPFGNRLSFNQPLDENRTGTASSCG
ncbi:MAG: hypothetical protein AMXMBFR4_07950 [Candidatus Hydrogenedentota bacterium]